MRYALGIVIGVIVACTVSYAGEQRSQERIGLAATADSVGEIGAPEALRLKIVQNGFLLDWKLSAQDPGSVTGYEIVRSDRFSGPYETVAKVEKGSSRYVDTSASREIIYFYKVRAAAGKGFSDYSNTVSGER